MNYICYIFLFFSTSIWAQQALYQAILNIKPDSIPQIELPTDSLSVCLKMNFANSQVLNPKDYEPLRGQLIEEVTLVYTSYHTPNFDQEALNRRRLKVLQAFAPEVFQQFQIRWKIVAQTAAASKLEGEQLFHGFIIRYQTAPVTVSMEDETKYLQSLFDKELPRFANASTPEDSIYRQVDRMPSFDGGEAEKRRYFDRNLKYPEQALKMGKEGTVLVSIIVDEDGNITNATLLRGFDAECDQEALRLVKEMPRWTPGMEGDDFVKVKLTYPVNFDIKNGGKKSDYIYYDEYWKEQNLTKNNSEDIPLPYPKASIENDVFVNRHPEWQNLSIACDLTGSMSPYTAQLLVWFKEDMQLDQAKIRYFSFFNDGDKTPNSDKKIGKTGGIYQIAARDFNLVKETVYQTMKAGNGGDLPENNIEASLAAGKLCPDCMLLMIADNYATPRDIALAQELDRPLNIIICGSSLGINPIFLDIARATKGAVYSKDFDVENLLDIEEGEELIIGNRIYQLEDGKFVMVR